MRREFVFDDADLWRTFHWFLGVIPRRMRSKVIVKKVILFVSLPAHYAPVVGMQQYLDAFQIIKQPDNVP